MQHEVNRHLHGNFDGSAFDPVNNLSPDNLHPLIVGCGGADKYKKYFDKAIRTGAFSFVASGSNQTPASEQAQRGALNIRNARVTSKFIEASERGQMGKTEISIVFDVVEFIDTGLFLHESEAMQRSALANMKRFSFRFSCKEDLRFMVKLQQTPVNT